MTTYQVERSFQKQIIQPPVEEYTQNASYHSLFQLSFQLALQAFTHPKSFVFNFSQFWADLAILLNRYNQAYILQFVCVIFGSIVLVQLRKFARKHVCGLLYRWQLLAKKDFDSFTESFFAWIIYFTLACLAYSIERDFGYIANSERLWSTFSLTNPIAFKVKLLFWLELSFYMQYYYYFAKLRGHFKGVDFYLILCHHLIAKALFVGWYWSNTVAFAIPSFLLFDFSGMVLTGVKCLVKLGFQNQKLVKSIRFVGFGSILGVFITTRMYYIPFKAIYPLALYMKHNSVDTWLPFTFINFINLWILILMNVFWIVLMFNILYKVGVKGDYKEIDDFREENKERKID